MPTPRPLLFATISAFATLTDDDRATVNAFAARGLAVEPFVWDDPAEQSRLETAAGVVIRSCWDYHLRPGAFDQWIAGVEAQGVPLVNAAPLVRWNLHKRYLVELAERGVPVVPTRLVERGSGASLLDVLVDAGWDDVVVKPAVSLSAYETFRTRRAAAATGDGARFAALVAAGDVLVQPFVREILNGEWSLIYFGGRFSHAVVKRAAPGDFRVQSDFGGQATLTEPSPSLRAQAETVLAALPVPAVYARLDGVDVGGRFVLMEAECIDPELHFLRHPPGAALFAEAVGEACRTATSGASAAS